MPIGGSAPNKTFTRAVNVYTGTDAWQQLDAAGRAILSVDQDDEANDQATALNAMLMRNGDNFNADIPTSGFKFTGVGDASARTHFAAAGQVQDGALIFAGTSAGTDTITATLSPAITAYVGGMLVIFRAGGTNTGAATLNLNSVGAADLKKGAAGTVALAAGDITTGGLYFVVYNGTTGDFELKNPKFPDGFATTDTPQFTALNIGAASDTTLSRASAGDLQIETNIIYRAGGTDVPAADGGTGRSSHTAYAVICGGTTATAAQQSIASVGTAGKVLTSNGAGALPTMEYPGGALIAIIEDQKAQNTAGGTFTSGADRTRTLNTLVYNRDTLVTLSSDQFTLPAGSWEIEWTAPGFNCDKHQSMLYDVTGAAVLARGSSQDANTGDSNEQEVNNSHGVYVVTPSGSNAYEIRHRCQTTAATNGLGIVANFGTEVYTRVVIRKV